MLSHFSVPARRAAFASLSCRVAVRLRGWVVPGGWIVGILLAAWLSDSAWLTGVVGVGGTVLATRHAVKTQETLRHGLERTEQARAAMELTLRRSQKMEALGRLTVGVAHDFNNHLTVISSNVEMVKRHLDDGAERALRNVEAAMQGVRRAASLTGRLLRFARDLTPEPEPVDIHRLLGGLSDLLGRTMSDRPGVELVLSDDPWFTWADAGQLENALLSLAVSVCDRTEGDTKLTIAVSNLPQETFASWDPVVTPGDYVQITIGGGAEPAGWLTADDISGADLSMARALVREAAGYLLRSAPAMWPADTAALRLLLPRYVPPALAAARERSAGRPTILVVEHDAAARRSCVEMLRALDYSVLDAADAMEAFRLITDRGGVDLLFTAVDLPGGVSGRDLADAARNANPGIGILFTASHDLVDLPERVASALVRKPFGSIELADKVRAMLTTRCLVATSPNRQGAEPFG